MNATLASSLQALRDADPAAAVDVRDVVPDWATISAALSAEPLTPSSRQWRAPRTRRTTRRWRLAMVGVLLVAAAMVASVVDWPWSSSGPQSVAFGVRQQSDGTVTVRISVAHPMSAAALQARLTAMGVPAVVLTESAPGACTEPAPVGVAPNGRLISYPSGIDRAEGFAVDAAAIPAGAVLVVELPPSSVTGAASYAGLFVTDNPPTCLAPRASGPIPPTSTGTGG